MNHTWRQDVRSTAGRRWWQSKAHKAQRRWRRLCAEVLEDRRMLEATPPTLVDLLPASDSGLHDDDNLTNIATPTIEITAAEPGDTIRVYRRGDFMGEAVQLDGLQYQYTFASGRLAEGTNAITARSFDGVQESEDSAPLVIELDTTGPWISDRSPNDLVWLQVDVFQSVAVTFSEPIDYALTGGNLGLEDVAFDGPSGGIGPTGVADLSDNRYEIAFPAQTQFGVYIMAVGPQVADLAGNLMDQNQDGTTGDSVRDAFSCSFYATSSNRWSSPDGYWPLDGTGVDRSGFGRDLTLQGGVAFVPGLRGQAMHLPNNVDQYASRDVDDADFDFGGRDFTVQVWVNFSDTSGEQVLLEKFSGSAGPGWTVYKYSNNTIQFYANGGGIQVISAAQPLVAGTWQQIVARRNGPRLDLFLNGERIGSKDIGQTVISDTANGLLIGKRNAQDGRGFPVRGLVDDAAIWTSALTDTEIDLLYNGGSGRFIPSVSHSPRGPQAYPVEKVTIRFPMPMDTSSFSLEQDLVAFDGPRGPLDPGGFRWGDPQTLEIIFDPQTAAGLYKIVIGPAVLDSQGVPLDLDGDGRAGETPDDQYMATFSILGPRAISSSPAGLLDLRADTLLVTFDRDMDPSTFTVDDVSIATPSGTIAPTAIVPRGGDTFEIAFDREQGRGNYLIAIGPHVSDAGDSPLDQDQDGLPGESEEDVYRILFSAFDADTVFNAPTTITEADQTYDGHNICVNGTTVTINGPHQFSSVQLVNGAVLTHSSNTATETHKLDLNLANELIVDATSRIDVSGKGYLPGRTTGNTTVGGAVGAAGGSYGGLGSGNVTNVVYGDYADPNDWGSGGTHIAGGPGGGLMRIRAAKLTLDGQLLASGNPNLNHSGSGGGIYVAVETLGGSGLIQAHGGRNAGGGRVAVYALDFTDFAPDRIRALGGSDGGGAGTVYLKDMSEPRGTLVIRGNGGITPLGLPSQETFVVSDSLVISGGGVAVKYGKSEASVEFLQSVTVDGSARLEVTGEVRSHKPVSLSSGAKLSVTGTLVSEGPLAASDNATVEVIGTLEVNDAFMLNDGSELNVTGDIHSLVDLTIDNSTVVADTLTAPGLSLVNEALLSSPSSTVTEMHKLDIDVAVTILVDATSRIDVSGKGYLPGRTTGNTTVGGAVGAAGGSYGGSGSGNVTNAVYGDYADPNDWGSGGTHIAGGPGGGLMRIRAARLTLDGQLLASGNPNLNHSGSGGGIFVAVETLGGSGLIQAHGGRNAGGGRVAVYALDFTDFAPGRITALGGSDGGGAGTVHIVQGIPPSFVRYHSPSGPTNALERALLTFTLPIDTASVDLMDVSVYGPLGRVYVEGLTLLDGTTYQLDLPPLTHNGTYHFTLPGTLLDARGVQLDQNKNGIPGEPEDFYAWDIIVDAVPPRVTNHAPQGDVTGTVDHIDVWFSEKIDPNTFASVDASVVNPGGDPIAVTRIEQIGLDRFHVSFRDGGFYGITQDGRLISIDPASGQGTLVGSSGVGVGAWEAIDTDGHGGLVGIGGANTLYRIDPATGSAQTIGNVSGYAYVEGLSFDHATNTLFASASVNGDVAAEQLITIDTQTAQPTLIGPFVAVDDVDGLAISPDGQLYGSDLYPNRLVRIDKTSGQATIIAALSTEVVGLDFAPDGTLYGTTLDGRLATIDLDDGTLTVVGQMGFGSIEGFKIVSSPSQTPEGTYHVLIGPDIHDLAGNPLDQDRDGNPNEPGDDVYDATFNLVPVDLQVSNVAVTPAELWSGEAFTVSWDGLNASGAPLLGEWTDAVYLSADDRWDIADLRVATVPHSGGLGEGMPYAASATPFVPGVLPGDYYVIVRADIFNQEREGEQEGNNVATAGPFPVASRMLPADGAVVNGTLTSADKSDYYAVQVEPGENLWITLDGHAGQGANEVYVAFERVPTRLSYDYHMKPRGQDLELGVPSRAGAGTWYVLVYCPQPAVQATYDVAARAAQVLVLDVTPPRHGNSAPGVFTFTGLGFDETTVVTVVGADSIPRSPTEVHVQSPTVMTIELDLPKWPAGTYTVRVEKAGGMPDELAGALTVLQGGTPRLETRLIVPGLVRLALVQQTIWIEYANTGDAPMPAPLLVLTSDGRALMSTDPDVRTINMNAGQQPPGIREQIQLLGLGGGATPGILQPGESRRVPVYYHGVRNPWPAYDFPLSFNLGVVTADSTTPIDWMELAAETRPEWVADDAWTAIAENLAAQVGDTWGDYVAMLDQNMDYLHGLGQSVTDIESLWSFEIAQASAALGPYQYLAAATDAYSPAPGLSLNFSRVYGQSIDARYELGPLGRGWSHNWDVRARQLANGDVVLRGPGGSDRYFTLLGGVYAASDGDYGKLTVAGGKLRLTEKHEAVWQFREDGLLDYVEDTNGNRITLGYESARLTSLTHSAGQKILLDYDAQGRILHVTTPLSADPGDDRVTSFTYDAAGEHLLSVTGPGDRTTAYSYLTGSGPQREHALLSIEYPDGLHDHFVYDERGRLVGTHGEGGAEAVTFGYDSAGTITVTDASDRQASLYFGRGGQLVQARDGEGNRIAMQYDDAYQLTGLTGGSGEQYQYTYDTWGNVTGIEDPYRRDTAFGYGSSFQLMTSVTDARGNGMAYAYDARGNLTSITYEDGTAETFTYDARGNVLTWTNRRGETVTYSYDAAGQLISKDYPDTLGVVDFQYTYDTAGNLVSATDPHGTTLMEYAPATDWLTRIEYPGGYWFTFEHDVVGRRTRREDQAGNIVNYQYDALGRLDRMTDASGVLIVDYDYDPAGRLSLKTLGNAVYTTYDYDAAGQLLHLVNYAPDDSVLSRFDYTYDASGRRTSMTTLEGTFGYGYDALGQLTRVTHPDGHVVEYVYDAAGNRIRVVDDGTSTPYTTNKMNQYTHVGDVTYAFDNDGNMISKTENGLTTTYVYDIENRLVEVSTPTDTRRYMYDGFGNRIASTQNGKATQYVIDPLELGDVAAEYGSGGALIARYDHGYGLLSRADESAKAAYYTFDALGNTRELTDASGELLNSYAYDPFGISLGKSEAVPNPFEFVGEYGVMKDGIGLEFMRARFYDAARGRFISTDPIGMEGGDANLYSYVGNRPTGAVDPAGTISSWPITWKWIKRVFKPNALEKFVQEEILNTKASAMDDNEVDVDGDGLADGLDHDGDGYIDEYFDPAKEPEWRRTMRRIEEREKAARDNMDRHQYGPRTERNQSAPPPDPAKHDATEQSDEGSSAVVRAYDPNDKLAPAGFGQERFIADAGVLPYQIRFENKADATAPAQRIVVTDTLDEDLDLRTFELTEIGFANQTIVVPTGLNHYEAALPLAIDNEFLAGGEVYVQIDVSLDPDTRELTFSMTGLDPLTGWLPEEIMRGLLYPNDDTGRGEGYVSYLVKPKAGLPSGTQITNRASIVFDWNDPIETPLVLNTIDSGTPTSAVDPLPSVVTSETFVVSWAGNDEVGGSGIAFYDVWVADNGGPYVLWKEATAETSAIFTAQDEHTYSFYTVATDNVGHREMTPETPDTVTTYLYNESPTDIGLSNDRVPENQPVDTTVGTFGTTDPDTGNAFTYTLVAGQGDTDNGSFSIQDDMLKTAGPFDYEGQSTYSIRVRTTDQDGLYCERAFTISVIDMNVAPTDLSLSSDTVPENGPGGTVVGTFAAVDAEPPATPFTYTLVAGLGSTDNTSFAINGDELTTTEAFDYETKNTYSIRVRSTDAGGLWYEGEFTVSVVDANDAPTGIGLSADHVSENLSGVTVGVLSATDPDVGQTHTFEVEDPASPFEIIGQTLKLKVDQFLKLADGATIIVQVIVTDSGSPPMQATLPVALTVLSNPYPWQNPREPLDVNDRDGITPQDVLLVINEINSRRYLTAEGHLPPARPASWLENFYDVDGDGYCTPSDVLDVINYINNHPSTATSGEGEVASPAATPSGGTLTIVAPHEPAQLVAAQVQLVAHPSAGPGNAREPSFGPSRCVGVCEVPDLCRPAGAVLPASSFTPAAAPGTGDRSMASRGIDVAQLASRRRTRSLDAVFENWSDSLSDGLADETFLN